MSADPLYTFSSYVFAFVVMLGVLIFVHELGHFLAAKACGIRVLKFSLGFGPPVGIGRFRLRWERGHTEYVVGWIPLGGFVKMLGEHHGEAEEEVQAHPSETLGAKPLWQKLLVVFAGPAMNLLLPVVVFAAILGVGLPQAAPMVGAVEAGSPAAEAGLRPGDRITAVDGEPVEFWRGIEEVLRERSRGSLTLRYERGDRTAQVRAEIEPRVRSDVFGENREVGWLGLSHRRPRAVVGIADPDAPARLAGLRSGDEIAAVAGEEVEDWYGFARAYAAAGEGGTLPLRVRRGEPDPETLEVPVPALGDVAALGVRRADVLVRSVEEGSPAAEAGLRGGDLIVRVDGDEVTSFDSFAARVRKSRGSELTLGVARGGEVRELRVAPELVPTDVTGLGIEVPRYRIGIAGHNLLAVPGAITVEQVVNPLVSVPRAFHMTVEITRVFMRGLGKLVTGEVSRKQVSGPIGIAEIAGKSLERGWMDFLQTLVLISINLGILNLLPIPILDGGQALVFLVESVRRAPLSLRAREFVQQVGLTALILIMGFAFWNDISRNWSRVVEWLTGGVS